MNEGVRYNLRSRNKVLMSSFYLQQKPLILWPWTTDYEEHEDNYREMNSPFSMVTLH